MNKVLHILEAINLLLKICSGGLKFAADMRRARILERKERRRHKLTRARDSSRG